MALFQVHAVYNDASEDAFVGNGFIQDQIAFGFVLAVFTCPWIVTTTIWLVFFVPHIKLVCLAFFLLFIKDTLVYNIFTELRDVRLF